MADGASESSLVFHPMDQFIVKPLFGDGAVGMFTVTNVTLWLLLAVACVIGLMVLGTAKRATVPSRTQSIAELIYGFVYKMVEDVTGKDGVKYFFVHLHAVHLNPVFELPRADPDVFLAHIAYRGNGNPWFRCVLCGHNPGFCQKRRGLPWLILGVERAACASPDPRGDRGHFLFRAPGQPFHSSGGQHHGRPRGFESVCRLRRADSCRALVHPWCGCDLRARSARVCDPGLRLYHSDLRVSQGCTAPVTLTNGT